MEISIASIKTKTITAKLRRATKIAIKKSMNQVGKEYKTFTIKRFRSQPAEWPPKKRPDGKPILVDTGRLRKDVVHLDMRLIGNTVKVAVKTPYAKFHQYGTSRMPKRTILIPPTKMILNKMKAIMKKELTRRLQ